MILHIIAPHDTISVMSYATFYQTLRVRKCVCVHYIKIVFTSAAFEPRIDITNYISSSTEYRRVIKFFKVSKKILTSLRLSVRRLKRRFDEDPIADRSWTI